MQENHRKEQDDSVGSTRAALNGHIVSSADYNWLKQGPANQPGGHLSASPSGPECGEKNFEEFQVNYKTMFAN